MKNSFCLRKSLLGKGSSIFMAIVGLAVMAFGITAECLLPDESHNLSMAAGFLTGIGMVMGVAGLISLIRSRVVSREKLLREEIEARDERNINISQRAGSIGFVAGTIIVMVETFILILLGYPVASFITAGGLVVSCLIVVIARAAISRKM